MKWFIKKILFYLLFLFLFFFKLINLFYKVRFSVVSLSRIGGIYHLDWEITKKKINNFKSMDIFFYQDSKQTTNKYWRDLWKNHVLLLKVPSSFITIFNTHKKKKIFKNIIIFQNRVNIFGENFKLFIKNKSPKLIEEHDFLLECIFKNNKPNIELSTKDILIGTKVLSRLGLERNKYICIHNRDDAYLYSKFSNKDWSYHDYRDFKIEDLKETVIEMINLGYKVVRVGSITKNELDIESINYFDYSKSDLRSDFLDIFLLSQCRFFISSDSGLSAVAEIFQKPIVYINKTLHRENHRWAKEAIVIYKKYYSKKEKRYLSFKESYELIIGGEDTNDILNNRSLILIDNTSEEIKQAVIEMNNYLNNNIFYGDYDEKLQNKYWDILKPHNKRSKNFRLGKHFLDKNSFLL